MEQGIIYRAKEGLFKYVGWPSVARGENGVMYAVCSGHRLGHVCPFGKNYLFKSTDDGKTWNGPIIINDTPFDDRDAGILPLSDDKLLLTWFINNVDLYTSRYNRIGKYVKDESLIPLWKAGVERWNNVPENKRMCGSFIKLSDDGGKTWSDAVEVPVSSPHGPTLLKNGKLIYLGTEISTDNPASSDLKSRILACESADGGRTWKSLGKVDMIKNDCNIFMCEPYQLELDDGTILGVIRVHEDPDAYKFCIYKTFSKDGGYTWSAPEYVCTGSPPHLFRHSSGAIILTYTLRYGHFGQRARISYDNGKTFGEEIVLCDNAVDWDSGYCSSTELSDGSIYTVYYQKSEGDNYCSLMYTKWSLPENK